MDDLLNLVDQITDTRLEGLRRPGSAFDFETSVAQLAVICRLAGAMAGERSDEVPDNIQQRARTSLQESVTLVERIEAFDPESVDAHRVHEQINTEMTSLRRVWVEELRQHIRGSVDSAGLGARAAQLIGHATDAERRAREVLTEAETILATVTKLSADLAADKLASYYRDQAADHATNARRFLYGAAASAVIVAVVGAVLLGTMPRHDPEDWTMFARDLAVRVFILGLGLYAISFNVRSYRANQHLRVVNEHKRNALNTFLLFQESTTSDVTRDLITAELVKAVFAADETGFLDSSPERTVIEHGAGIAALLSPNRSS